MAQSFPFHWIGTPVSTVEEENVDPLFVEVATTMLSVAAGNGKAQPKGLQTEPVTVLRSVE